MKFTAFNESPAGASGTAGRMLAAFLNGAARAGQRRHSII